MTDQSSPMKASRKITLVAVLIWMTMAACAAPTVQPTTTSVPGPTTAPAPESTAPPTPVPTPTPMSAWTATSAPEPTPAPTVQPTAIATPKPASLERIGQIGGGSKAVAIQGHYAYLNVGPRLLVLDIADLTHPTFVGQSSPLPSFESVAVAESHAYIAGEGGLQVIDVSDPTAPTEVGLYATTGSVWSVAVMDTTAYLATDNGLHIVDVSNPIAPTGVGFYDTPDTALDVTVIGNIAYVAEVFSENDDPTERGGLRIVDISDPATPSEIGYYPMNPSHASEFERSIAPRGARGVAVAGTYAYLTYRTWKEGGLRILDISDPGNPTEIGDYQDYVYFISDVTVVGDPTEGSEPVYAYVTTGVNYGLVTLDVSDPTQPTLVSMALGGRARGIAAAGSALFIADEAGGLHVADISDPAHPFEVGSFEPLGLAGRVEVVGDLAYVIAYYHLWVVDISDPTRPTLASAYEASHPIKDVAAIGTTIYIAAEAHGLVVVDASDPAHLVRVGAYQTSHLARGVAVSGNYVYVADYSLIDDGRLLVLNVSEPEKPVAVAVYQSPRVIEDVIIVNDTAYLTGDGLHILDISDPTQPAEIGFYATSGSISDAAAAGAYVYLIVEGELQVVDVSNPAHPFEQSSFDTEYGDRIAVTGDYAYIVGEGHMQVVNTSDPTTLALVVSYSMLKYTYDVAIVGDSVCVADGANGLTILQLDDHHR